MSFVAQTTLALPVPDGKDGNGNPIYSGDSTRYAAGDPVTKTDLRAHGIDEEAEAAMLERGEIAERGSEDDAFAPTEQEDEPDA